MGGGCLCRWWVFVWLVSIHVGGGSLLPMGTCCLWVGCYCAGSSIMCGVITVCGCSLSWVLSVGTCCGPQVRSFYFPDVKPQKTG